MTLTKQIVYNAILGVVTNTPSSTGSAWPYALTWNYQTFNTITDVHVVLTQNQNGDVPQAPSNIINGSGVITDSRGLPVYTGLFPIFSQNVYVTSQIGTAVTLNAIPYSGDAPFRLWWLAKNVPLKGAIIAPDFVTKTRLNFLNSTYVSEVPSAFENNVAVFNASGGIKDVAVPALLPQFEHFEISSTGITTVTLAQEPYPNTDIVMVDDGRQYNSYNISIKDIVFNEPLNKGQVVLVNYWYQP